MGLVYILETRFNNQLFSTLSSLRKTSLPEKGIILSARINESTYRKSLAGEAVRMDVLERICLALNVDIGDLQSQTIKTVTLAAKSLFFKMFNSRRSNTRLE